MGGFCLAASLHSARIGAMKLYRNKRGRTLSRKKGHRPWKWLNPRWLLLKKRYSAWP